MEKQTSFLNEENIEKFKNEYLDIFNKIYCSENNELKETTFKNISTSHIIEKIKNYSNDMQDEMVSELLTELYVRVNHNLKSFPCDKVEFTSKEQDSFGMHYLVGQESNKMAIKVFNSKNYFDNMFKIDKTFNSQNLGMNILSTFFHENAHDRQVINIGKFLNGELNEEYDKVMSFVYFSTTAKLLTVPYSSQLIEFDANFNSVKNVYNTMLNSTKFDFNNKLSLYNDILIALHSPLDDIVENNLKYVEQLKEIYGNVNNDKIKNLANINGNSIEVFKKEISKKYEILQKMRINIERILKQETTRKMQEKIENLSKNNKIDKKSAEKFYNFESKMEFDETNCHNFKRVLALANYELNLTDNKKGEIIYGTN